MTDLKDILMKLLDVNHQWDLCLQDLCTLYEKTREPLGAVIAAVTAAPPEDDFPYPPESAPAFKGLSPAFAEEALTAPPVVTEVLKPATELENKIVYDTPNTDAQPSWGVVNYS